MNNSPAKINLMHVVLSLMVGGLERLVAETSLKMNREIFNIEVCCIDELGHFSQYLTERGIRVTLLERNHKHYDALYPFRLMKLLRRKNIHIMQMHSGTFFLATQAGVLARTPVRVYTDHGRALEDTPLRIREDRLSALFVDKIIAVSQELERYLLDIVKLSPKKTVTVINGINTAEFCARAKPRALLEEFKITDDRAVIGTVGRFDEVKDQISLIKAFKMVHERIPRSVLMLVGDGPMKQQLMDVVNDHGLNNVVFFTGNRKDVPALLNLFDLFVLTSLSEGTSISLLEAMASGLASVVTNVGGNASIVDNNVNGIVIEPKSVPEIADAITGLLTGGDMRRRFGNNALAKVRNNYSIEKMVERYTAIYFELLRKQKKFKHANILAQN